MNPPQRMPQRWPRPNFRSRTQSAPKESDTPPGHVPLTLSNARSRTRIREIDTVRDQRSEHRHQRGGPYPTRRVPASCAPSSKGLWQVPEHPPGGERVTLTQALCLPNLARCSGCRQTLPTWHGRFAPGVIPTLAFKMSENAIRTVESSSWAPAMPHAARRITRREPAAAA